MGIFLSGVAGIIIGALGLWFTYAQDLADISRQRAAATMDLVIVTLPDIRGANAKLLKPDSTVNSDALGKLGYQFELWQICIDSKLCTPKPPQAICIEADVLKNKAPAAIGLLEETAFRLVCDCLKEDSKPPICKTPI